MVDDGTNGDINKATANDQRRPSESSNLLSNVEGGAGGAGGDNNSAAGSYGTNSSNSTAHQNILFAGCGPAAGIFEHVISADIMEDLTRFEEVPEEILMQEVEEHHHQEVERDSDREHFFDENPLVKTFTDFFHDEPVVDSPTGAGAGAASDDDEAAAGVTPESAAGKLRAIDENKASAEGTTLKSGPGAEEEEDDEPHLTYPEEQIIESHYTSSPEKLGVISLAVLVFYNVSGGPFGVETTVRAGGNFYALVGFLVMPFCWSLQEALLTAELGSTFVEASGGVAWVEEAFGPGAGWIAGYLGWIAGATDSEYCAIVLVVFRCLFFFVHARALR
jgi:hypothetical protein